VTSPKDPRDEWNEIVGLAASRDVDDIADMSEADVDAELAKAGFDVDEENREGKAEHDAAVRARARKAKPKPRPSRASVWLATPAAALVALGSAAVMLEPVVSVVGSAPDAGQEAGDAGAEGGESGAPR
jgi:hypothetical protein